jgi:hypothetical protein
MEKPLNIGEFCVLWSVCLSFDPIVTLSEQYRGEIPNQFVFVSVASWEAYLLHIGS